MKTHVKVILENKLRIRQESREPKANAISFYRLQNNEIRFVFQGPVSRIPEPSEIADHIRDHAQTGADFPGIVFYTTHLDWKKEEETKPVEPCKETENQHPCEWVEVDMGMAKPINVETIDTYSHNQLPPEEFKRVLTWLIKRNNEPTAKGKSPSSIINSLIEGEVGRPQGLNDSEAASNLDLLHQTITPRIANRYGIRTFPTWMRYWKKKPSNQQISRKWINRRSSENQLFFRENQLQRETLASMVEAGEIIPLHHGKTQDPKSNRDLFKKIAGLEKTANILIENRIVPESWFLNPGKTHALDRLWEAAGYTQKGILMNWIWEDTRYASRLVKTRSTIGKILKQKTVGAL